MHEGIMMTKTKVNSFKKKIKTKGKAGLDGVPKD